MQLNLRSVRATDADPLVWEVARPLVEADIQMLSTTSRNSEPSALKRLTERHHAAARLIAVGTPLSQVSIITGYVASRLSILQNDPSFQELILFYREAVNDEYRTMQAQLAGLGEDALAELRSRLEEAPEKMSNTFLLDLVKSVADRTGNGPSSSTKAEVVVTLDLAARMKQARAKAAAAIDGVARDITPAPANAEEGAAS